jgi:hypothetical protein
MRRAGGKRSNLVSNNREVGIGTEVCGDLLCARFFDSNSERVNDFETPADVN